MKVECLKEKLETAIIRAERVTNKNVTLPVLKNIFSSKSSMNTYKKIVAIVRVTKKEL